MFPGRVIVPAFVDQELPGAVGRIAHRIAATVMEPGHLAHFGPAFAVLARGAGLNPAFACDALARVRLGIWHRAGERGAARGQRPAQGGIRQASRECHRRAALSTYGPAVSSQCSTGACACAPPVA